jgi:multidrug efflux system membrane fusion protein
LSSTKQRYQGRLIGTALLAAVAAGVWAIATGRAPEGITRMLEPALNVLALGPERGTSQTQRRGPPGGVPSVTVSKPVTREVIEWDEYTGRLEAAATVEVRARVAGYLDGVHFKDGQIVKQGDLLYTIDPRPFERTLDQARAEVAQARTKVENSMKDVERGRPLVDRKFMSEKVFDDRENLKREAESALKVAEAKVRTAELELAFTRIATPISGRISRSLITPGNYVTGGGGAQPTLLTTIVSQNPIHLYLDISEANAIKYRRLAMGGNTSVAGQQGSTVELALPDESGYPHRGSIDFTDNRIDISTGTLRVRAIVDNAKGLFAAGMFARVRVAGTAPYRAVLLPDSVFGTDQANKFALTVTEDGTVQRRVVTLGPMAGNLRIVRSGLSADDWVIVNGLQRARPGQKAAPKREPLQVTEAPTGSKTTAAP